MLLSVLKFSFIFELIEFFPCLTRILASLISSVTLAVSVNEASPAPFALIDWPGL